MIHWFYKTMAFRTAFLWLSVSAPAWICCQLPQHVMAQNENLSPKEIEARRLAAVVATGPYHEFLQRFIGTWNTEVRFYEGTAASPPERGIAECVWQIEGRWILLRNTGTMGGQPFHSETTMGYDNFRQSFVASTISNLDTAMLRSEGDLNQNLTTLTFFGTIDEYASGQLGKPVKYVWSFQSFDRMTFEIHDISLIDQQTRIADITYYRKLSDKVFPDSPVPQLLWNEGAFTEGVAVRSDGQVFFSDIPSETGSKGRILQFDPKTGKTSVFCTDSKKSNGLAFDPKDRLFACCGANEGARALCEVTADGQIVALADRFNGRAFNSPNDLVVMANGNVYFTDPRYVGKEPIEMDSMNVYLLNTNSNILSIATREIEKPNGIEASPDGNILYVAETNNGSLGLPGEIQSRSGRMTLNAFDIDAGGRLRNKRVLVDFGDKTGIDGMCVHKSGRIFAALRTEGRSGIVVYSPVGDEIAFVPTPELPTNCCFGTGENSNVLYITAGRGLYRLMIDEEATNEDR